MSAVLAIAGADAAERVRRFAFLLTIAAALYAGYVYIPDAHAAYATVAIQAHRGAYTSAYVGAAIALLSNTFLSLFGFFLVRGAVERDRQFHVDGVVCASPVKRVTFLLGKVLSNLGVLLAVAAISLAAGIFMQELRGEDRHIDLLAYFLPFVVFTLPAMSVVAALAVVFDVVGFLRGAIGTMVYVLGVWLLMLMIPTMRSSGMTKAVFLDPLGATHITSSLFTSARRALPGQKIVDISIGGSPVPRGGIGTYHFDGFHWTQALLLQRATWLLLALVAVLACSLLFDRFRRESTSTKQGGYMLDAARLIPNWAALRLFRAEFALLLNGASLWWFIGAIALVITSAVLPLDAAVRYVLPIVFIWPLERLSALGSREHTWHVEEILSCTGRYAQRATLAQWAAGTLVGALLCGGFLVHVLLIGNVLAALACVLAVAATAACALALGTISGAPRLFEAGYLLLWYVGPINAVPVVDFAGATIHTPAMLAAIASAIAVPSVLVAAYQRR